MKIQQLKKTVASGWQLKGEKLSLKKPLVLVFGERKMLESDSIFSEVRDIFPDGELVFGSTSGNIMGNTVEDDSIVITAIEFEKSRFEIKTSNILSIKKDSHKTGSELIKQFNPEGLKYIFILSEGSFINGSELTKGLNSSANNNLLITGGLCGDNSRFEKTVASYNEQPKSGEVIAIGFYGESVDVSFSIHGGWTPFGPERIVTKATSNILYELDNQPALDLYKRYLGEESKNLPSSALLYPLEVTFENSSQSVTRTILNIDEENNAMILAGDIPEGSVAQLMTSSVDNIVDASELAAAKAIKLKKEQTQLAILISCIGRKLVLDHRVEEEVEEIIETIGDNVTYCGFYSYGEIAPFDLEISCQLHNQTMAITLLSE